MKLRSSLAGMGALALGLASADAATVVVTSDITTNTTWSASNQYVLQGSELNQGVIRVTSGATLTIQAGTIVRGQPRTSASSYDAGSLAVLPGSKMVVQGSATNPVIFTTAAVDNDSDGYPDGFTRENAPGASGAKVYATRYTTGSTFWDASPLNSPKDNTVTGLWGGVIVLGKAPTNYASTTNFPIAAATGNPTTSTYAYSKPIVEGLTSPDYEYGGTDAHDSSGTFEYLSIRHGGIQIAQDSEVNGLTLAGVGDGTKIQYVEVWGNEDDGIEVFGGTVNLKYLLIVGTKDDGLDLDQGWTGNAQFVCVVGGSYADKLLEWDGDDSTKVKANWEPRATGMVFNGTFIGGPTVNTATDAGVLAHIKANSAYRLQNSIFANMTAGPNNTSNRYTLWGVSALNYIFRNVTTYLGTSTNNLNGNEVVTGLGNALNTTGNPGYLSFTFTTGNNPSGDTAGLQKPSYINPVPGKSGGSVTAYLVFGAELSVPPQFFTQVGYRGAFSNSSAATLWTTGWTAANKSGAFPSTGNN